MRRKKISGTADYIIPLAIVAGVVGIGYAVYSWLTGGSSGSGGGLPSAANSAINNLMASSPPATQTATMMTGTQLDAWYQTQVDATNPFLQNMYSANPSCATITVAIANDLFSTMYTAANAGAFFKPTPDMTGILSQWQQYVKNQCDASFVANQCMQQAGTNLWAFMEKYFENDQTGSSGQTNAAMLWAFVQWVAALPSGLPQD
jgi:hypothetical protein